MSETKPGANKTIISTQKYLDIAEVKESTIIMKDGTLRAVLGVSSINFALKSEDEQNAVISAYVSFLNNISSPIEIVIQSRELNINHYLESLSQKAKEQTNKLLKMQTIEYINYIKELVSIGKIMSKRFYVVISYNPSSDGHKTFFSSLLEVFRPATSLKLRESKFVRYKGELDRRVESVVGGLSSLGIEINRLSTQELIELFYHIYNPETSQHEPLVDLNKLKIEA